MAERSKLGSKAVQALISVAVAGVLLGVTTLGRLALSADLGVMAPFMLYVVAVLLAGLLRGPFCGLVVMAAGGYLGFRLFLAPNGGPAPHGAGVALMLFWGVSAPVLVTANELRVQLTRAMARLSAALDRSERPAT